MPDTLANSPYLDRSRTYDEARRDELRGLLDQIDAIQRRLQPGDEGFDPLSWARNSLSDAAADIHGEINRLTDAIGDERGDDYAGERSMAQFRSIG